MRSVSELRRQVAPFEVVSDFSPGGDQPAAINDLERRINAGEQDVVLMGATGTGKTATVAWLTERLQRPTLVIMPNKTLASQFATELRDLFPNNAVEYFVSYYDYYQPEAYIAQSDTYIEKDSSVNEEVERLRHSATWSLLTRRDVIVVASVSCIYGLGSAQEYLNRMIGFKVGEQLPREQLLRTLVQAQYVRNDVASTRGTFRVKGDTVEIFPVYQEMAVRVEFFGDEIERLMTLHPLTGEVLSDDQELFVGAATHYAAGNDVMKRAIKTIGIELEERLAELEGEGKLLEAQRLAHAHDLRHRDDGADRHLRRHRELLAPHGRSRRRVGAQLSARLLPRGLHARGRRVARDDPADRCDVRRRHVAQALAGRARFPAAECDGQPSAQVGRVPASASARRSTSRRRRAPTRWPRSRTTSSSRSSARPD